MSHTGPSSMSTCRLLRSDQESTPSSLASPRFDPEWEPKEELQKRELEEARARAAQMEKTMRWWSDCTANWREKWSKVRNERNKAREESKLLRLKLESLAKDTSIVRRERQELETENAGLRRDLECMHSLLVKQRLLQAEREGDAATPSDTGELELEVASVKNADDEVHEPATKEHDVEESEDKMLQLEQQSHDGEIELDRLPEARIRVDCEQEINETQKNVTLRLRLEEATKTVGDERDLCDFRENAQLHHLVEKLRTELGQLQTRYEDLKSSRQEVVHELMLLQASHQDEMHLLQLNLRDEASTRETMDRRLADLRAELEQLQAENAAEWGRRERVETEKQSLEREVKKLRSQLVELESQLEQGRKGKSTNSTSDWDLRQSQQDLAEKKKELFDLRHAHSKLKKVLQDKSTELGHALRRSEQYDAEVRRLRGRVEELKRELASAEDEVDSATNNIRRLQRTNDELQEQVDSLQVQIDHLQTRLRNSNSDLLRGTSLLRDGPSDEDSNEY